MSEIFIHKGYPGTQLAGALESALIEHHLAGGVYIKATRIPAGMVLVQHKHLYDHLSILASGSILIDVNGEQSVLLAPQVLTIKAGAHHGIKALEDTIWYCVHASDVADDDAVIANPSDIAGAGAVAERLKGN